MMRRESIVSESDLIDLEVDLLWNIQEKSLGSTFLGTVCFLLARKKETPSCNLINLFSFISSDVN